MDKKPQDTTKQTATVICPTAFAAGHAAAVFKHRWFDGHDVIRRMTFGGG